MALSPENITELFRFALLLTGDDTIAGELLVEAVAATPDEITQLRDERPRVVWLLKKIRDDAGKRRGTETGTIAAKVQEQKTGEGAMSGDSGDVQAFSALKDLVDSGPTAPVTASPPPSTLQLRIAALPEAERSALALFYIDLLEPREQAQFFGISIEELSERLGSARKLLQEASA